MGSRLCSTHVQALQLAAARYILLLHYTTHVIIIRSGSMERERESHHVHACRAPASLPLFVVRCSLGFSGRQTSSQSSRDGDGWSIEPARARARSLVAIASESTLTCHLAERVHAMQLALAAACCLLGMHAMASSSSSMSCE